MEQHALNRRWIRFRIRTLLILITVTSIFFGWVAWNFEQRRKEQAAISWLQKMGGQVIFFSSSKPDERGWWEKRTDAWFGEQVRTAMFRNGKEEDLSQLREFKNMECLALSYTSVTDISPLAELKKLDELYLEGTNVQDISPLAGLKNLEMLWLDNTPVVDLTPLTSLKKLKWLKLRNTLVSKQQVQDLKRVLPNCDIVHTLRKQ